MSKKSFKVVLNSYDTSNFTGVVTNASYYVDLKTVLRDPKDYEKSWYMTYCLKSISASAGTSGINPTKLYGLTINLGKGINTVQNKTALPLVGILNINNDFTAYTSTACPTFFDTKDSDNKPTFIDNLKNITNIQVIINDITNGVIHDALGTNANSNKYICILTFEEAQ